MERSRSTPPHGSNWTGNPFYSQRAQNECLLQSLRPSALPLDQLSDDARPPLPNLSGMAPQSSQEPSDATGKGRGGAQAGLLDALRPTGHSRDGVMTDGKMPTEEGSQSMGPVNVTTKGEKEKELEGDGLQRALEGEMVDFLRRQNSKLMDDVEYLKGKLELLSAGGKADSGADASPWSTVGGVPSSGVSHGESGHVRRDRSRRHGSRTPRSKIREAAVSPERTKDPVRFTPNGTQVPSGPPPSHVEDMPPVPPFPVCHGDQSDGHDLLQKSFESQLYDTCESKHKVKNGDVAWRPQNEKRDAPEVLTASEAKQLWLEREVQSLKTALDRVSVPLAFQQSEYWTTGFDSKGTPETGPCAAASVNHPRALQHRAVHGGSGAVDLQHRALHGDYAAADPLHGASFGGSGDPALQHRALQHGDPALPHRALQQRHDVFPQDRAASAIPSVPGGVRAAYLHGEHRDHDRALRLHGEDLARDRAFHMHGPVFGQDRAWQGHDAFLHDKGSAHPCPVPGHDVGGGGFGGGSHMDGSSPAAYPSGPWHADSHAGNMNTKGELPDLPANSTPLHFGDWLHLIAPVMKDISGFAGWWWERTLNAAKVYYEQWKSSTPLQRIQIEPRLPEELREHKFQRTEQRGIQMLLKSIPEAEQQSLVTDRALSTTAILYKLLVRFQPGGAGEKQLLLSQLTSLPTTKSIHDLAAAIRNWRRHFGRAQEVQAVLPDGVLLLKALDGPIQHLASLDQQAAFRLAQSRMQLQLDEKPVHSNLWAFSQCLLAEAETLCLLTTSPPTLPQTPLKMKQLQGQGNGDSKTTSSSTPDTKPKSNGSIDKPCKYWVSGQGCRAGKSCKWQHSWEGIEDKSSRCWICGGKDHVKNDCKLKASNKRLGEPGGGSGGGRGGSSSDAATSSTSKSYGPGGKAGAAAVKVTKGVDESSSTATTDTVPCPSEVTTDQHAGDDKGEVRSGGSDNSAGGKTAELLQEATRLLKTLQLPAGGPKLKVMQLAGIDQANEAVVLIDSGATHALRPARDMDEWCKSESTTVHLAEGSTTRFRLKPGTRILLSEPNQRPAWIIPMGGLAELDFTLRWSGNQCTLQDDMGRNIEVQVQNGCPMVSLQDGQCLLEWLEGYYVHQMRKMIMIRTLLTDEEASDKSRINVA